MEYSHPTDLISYQDYKKQFRGSRTSLSFRNKNQLFLFFGVQHKKDIRAPHFARLQRAFGQWLKQKKTSAVILAEGTCDASDSSLGAMVKKYGEVGFLTFLARRNGIRIISIEPKQKDIEKEFFRHTEFSKKDFSSWIDMQKKFFAYHEQGKKKEAAKVKKMLDPFGAGTIFNDISAQINLMRDHLMAEKVLAELHKGRSCFGVVGVNHAVVQRQVYERYFYD